jgi:hypothetical protein
MWASTHFYPYASGGSGFWIYREVRKGEGTQVSQIPAESTNYSPELYYIGISYLYVTACMDIQ